MRKDRSLGEVVEDVNRQGPMTILPFHIPPLDDICGGMGAGEVVVVAARPSIGKSAFALDVLTRLAETGTSVGMISMEMSAQSLLLRLQARYTGTPITALRAGNVPDNLSEATARIIDLPFTINDSPALTGEEIRDKIIEWHSQGIDCVAVDYMQYVVGQGDNHTFTVAKAMRHLKEAARETNIPVLCLAQLNRGASFRSSDEFPRIHDIKDSGQIEQDADLIVILHPTEDQMNLILAKNRQGRSGVASVKFDKVRMTFEPQENTQWETSCNDRKSKPRQTLLLGTKG